MSRPLAVAVLISGRGSNLQALMDACDAGQIDAQIVAAISNVPGAPGLARAAAAGINTAVIDHTAFSTRALFDRALRACIDDHGADLIVLAGFMRVLTAGFVEHYRGRIINIHPSLLPAFPGLDTHRRALEAGVNEHGVTVHFVTAELDGGPPIAQARVPVLADDDERALAARVLVQEHRLLPQVVGMIAQKRLCLDRKGRVSVDGRPLGEPLQAT